MDICIFGKPAKTVIVDGHRMKLVDVDKKNGQLLVCGARGEEWIPLSKATFDGKSFENRNIRLPEASGSEKKKFAIIRSAIKQIQQEDAVAA